MNSEQFLQKPDIKLSVKQTFGLDSDMKVGAFSKKMNMSLKLIPIINLIRKPHFQYWLASHSIKEF